MTDLEKILIKSLIDLIRNIEDYEDSFYINLECDAKRLERGGTKIACILDNSIQSLCHYIDLKDNRIQISLSDIVYEYLYKENYSYEKIIKIFETIEKRNNN